LLGDWRNLPLEDSSCDVVLGDGCFTLLDYPVSYHQVLQEIKRILKPKGLFSMRFFLSPTSPEHVSSIFKKLEAGNISSFHLFKWRLAMALQKSTREGIAVSSIYQAWKQNIAQPEKLLEKLGWSIDLLETINIYEKSPSIYTFPTLGEIKEIFADFFVELSCYFPTYQSGELFPTMIFKKSHLS
jgi:SAM-dependent methyltransferase